MPRLPGTPISPRQTQPRLTLDMGKLREFGGLKLAWKEGEFASDYLLQLSDDGAHWRDVRTVVGGNGGTDYLALPESEARYLRLSVASGPGKSFGLAEAAVQPLEFAATPNDFIKSVASESPRGWYPRGFTGEQPYWTIVGLDGGTEQALIGEDGAVEVAKGGFSIEPFVVGRRQARHLGRRGNLAVVAGRLPADSQRELEAWGFRPAGDRIRAGHAAAFAVGRRVIA